MQGRYTNKTNRFTLLVNYNYALRNYYNEDVNRTPTASTPNSFISISSDYKGVATVDWGDGIIEKYPFVEVSTGGYLCAFRSLKSESRQGGVNDWYWDKPNGQNIIPYPNHHYADDSPTTQRKITITCSQEIRAFTSQMNKLNAFPLLECESLVRLGVIYPMFVNEIPVDRISSLKKLEELQLQSLGAVLQVLPSSLFGLTNLKKLTLSKVANLENQDSSNIRLIKNLKHLEYLDLSGNNMGYYIKEFNDLPKLTTLDISTDIESAPLYTEVSSINTSLKTYYNLQYVRNRTEYDNLSGKGIDKLNTISNWDSLTLRVDTLPSYWLEMRSVSSINYGQALRTQQRADDFVNAFYSLVTGWNQLTMTQTAKDGLRNQFYKLSVTIYSAIYQADKRPSGTYKAPTGFVLGSANGNPSSPMEKIYVLVMNYAQNWTVRPA